MQRAMSCQSQFTAVEALYAEMAVGTPHATTHSLQDLAKSSVDTKTSCIAHKERLEPYHNS